MSKIFPISRWLVVDDVVDDAEDIALAIEGLGGKADVADSIRAAERLLRKNIYDMCVVDCFYKGSTKWGADILPELRATLPGLPVVMISSSDDIDLPGKVIRAGADAFCPKLKDSFSLTKVLGACALQAIASRKLKLLEYHPFSQGELFLTKPVLDVIEHSIRRKEERLLVCGASGTGKTKVSQLFSQRYLKHNFGSISRNIVYHQCGSLSEEATACLLFGASDNEILPNKSTLQLTLFERAVGGVLILDDVHLLSKDNQLKLKHMFDSEMIISHHGEQSLPLSLIKCVATVSIDESAEVIPGFLEAFAHRELDLPSVAELRTDLEKVIDFLFQQQFSQEEDMSVSYGKEVLDKIVHLIQTHVFPSNMRTLSQLLENALNRALSDERSQIFPSDIELVSSVKPLLKDSARVTFLQGEEGINHVFDSRLGESLLRFVASGENFDGAKDILRKMMIQVALKKHGGNKSKVAVSLGISRQSLYDHEGIDS